MAVDDSLNTHRRWLSQNRLFHDKQKCPQTIREYLLHKVRARREGDAKDLEVDRWNHCLAGDTLIDMPGSPQPIKSLVGTKPYVYCVVDGQLAVRQASEVTCTGHDVPVVRVLMDRGEITCTADHLFMLANGTYVEAAKLKPAQSLMALNRYVMKGNYTRLALTGCTNRTKAEHVFVYEQVYGPVPESYQVHHLDRRRWNNHPDNLVALSLQEHTSLHHAGKTISEEQRAGMSKSSQQMWADDREHLLAVTRENIRKAQAAARIHPASAETRAKIGAASRAHWNRPGVREAAGARRRGRHHTPESRERMSAIKREYWARRHAAEAQNHKVIAVIPAGKADVYDMTVPEAHNFVANGVVVHNSHRSLSYLLVLRYGVTDGTLETVDWTRQIARPDRRQWVA